MELPPQTSPAESFVSTPGDNYSSLFAVSTPGASHTVNPMDMMTPSSSADDGPSRLSAVPEDAEMDTPGPDDSGKPTKKRKSWGQVLPEPKTNLPPRKRAKTDDEKEQRRVERVLRNRRAAQSSRERKRLEVEALEQRNKELEDMLLNAQKANQMLVEELSRFQRDNGAADRASPLDSLRDNVTLSQQLFSSQDGLKTTLEQSSLMSNLMNPTVNPASLSPELGPVDSANNQLADSSEDAKPSEQTLAPSPDLTQHPAVSHVGGGAQVVPGLADLDDAALGLVPAPQDDAAFSLDASFGLSSAADADRYVLESGLLASPNSSTFDDDYLVADATAGFPAFDINDFLTDDANNVASEFMAASDNAAADHGLDLSVFDPETQVSSENPIQQPQSGASSYGCDDGGIAVGV